MKPIDKTPCCAAAPVWPKVFRFAAVAVYALVSACHNETPMVSLGVDESYTVYRMQALRLESEFEGDVFSWVEVAPDGSRRVISTSRECVFVAASEGVYGMSLTITDDDGTLFSHDFTVTVVREEIEYSPWLSAVYEYRPAPGQFINMMPEWSKGDTEADMCAKVLESVGGTADEMVSLGAYGGYLTFGFDHTVVNVAGEPDFMIRGNAFYEIGFEDSKVGSCEPGIVMVSLDVNGNGVPDDPWYELAGSEYSSPFTLHNYRITYRRPDASKPAVPKGDYILDAEYIPWTDSEGNSGYVEKNYEHTQNYYPAWVDADELSFSGSLLAPNAVDIYGNGTYFQLSSYPWGYVDNHPDRYGELNSFDIGWAVDAFGVPVFLPGVDFIRVYTGINQSCNWIGETSTEITGARDLHLLPLDNTEVQ